MKVTFLVSLHHIEIKENLNRGEKLDDNTFLSNDVSFIDKTIPHDLIPVMGLLEINDLKSNKVFIYSIEDIPDDSDAEQYLMNRLYFVHAFLSVFWLYQEHNINTEQGFIFYSKNGVLSISSNSIGSVTTLANGQRKKTIIDREKLREIRKANRAWDPDIYEKNTQKKGSSTSTKLIKDRNRLEIAIYHIAAARSAPDLGMKISHYCSSLETLFTTSQAELAHQISERLAFFIGNTSEDKVSIYRHTKKAYTARSKVVHGATFKEKDLNSLELSSIFCDESLRAVIMKILLDETIKGIFEGSNEDLENYMLNLVFGVYQC